MASLNAYTKVLTNKQNPPFSDFRFQSHVCMADLVSLKQSMADALAPPFP